MSIMPILLALQAIAVQGDGAERLTAVRACPSGPSVDGTIVVCGRKQDQRLPRLPERPVADPAQRLTWRGPGGGTINAHAIRSELPGAVGQGAAVTLTIPLGGKR